MILFTRLYGNAFSARPFKSGSGGPRSRALLLFLLLWLVPSSAFLPSQTKVKPGFNIFSVEQDVEIGRQSAAEIEKQLPLLKNGKAESLIDRIGQRLAGAAPGADFPYQFKVVNVSDINAFALPGGFMYINRGLIEAAANEAELAGVMGHEMAHVALRHGTNQASKAYLAQAGLGLLGSLLGGGSASTAQMIGAIGGFGLNAVFMKFSRTAETQADVVGAQMLANAGYDPLAMRDFFHTLQQESGRNPGKLEQFFSSHPAPEDRARRIEEETRLLGPAHDVRQVGGFDEVRSQLKRMPPAPSMQQLAAAQSPGPPAPSSPSDTADAGQIEKASSRFGSFRDRTGQIEVRYPENWQVLESRDGSGATIAPRGGIVQLRNAGSSVLYGIILSRFQGDSRSGTGADGPFRGRNALERAANQLVGQIRQDNSYLKPVSGSARSLRVDGKKAVLVTLSGISSITGMEERVSVVTGSLKDGSYFYTLLIAPQERYSEADRIYNYLLSSIEISDR